MAFFPVYADISGGAAVSAWDPGLIAELVESLNERDAEFAASFCASLHEYLHFLGNTGRWSGTRESQRGVHAVLCHGMLNEKSSPAGSPRSLAGTSHVTSRNSA